MRLLRITIVTSVIVSLFALCWPLRGMAEGPSWGRPVNLSRSGAASDPSLLYEGDQTYALWWDSYDGVTVAVRSDGEWGNPTPVPISDYLYDASGSIRINATTGVYLRDTIRSGSITADGTGGVAAFFLARAEGSGPLALRQTRAALDTFDWAAAQTVVSAASGWRAVPGPDGTLHLAVFYTGRDEGTLPGVYYLRSEDGGESWSDMVLVAESLYVRRATPEKSHISLSAVEGGAIYLAWNEPGTGRALWSWSQDGGDTWSPSRLVAPDDPKASNAHLESLGDGRVLLLWEGTGTGDAPALYSSVSPDGGSNWPQPDAVLSLLNGGAAGLALQPHPAGGLLLAAGGVADGPALARFGKLGEEIVADAWSDCVTLPHVTGAAERLRVASVERWQAVAAAGEIILTGVDPSGDVWALSSAIDTLEWPTVVAPTWEEDADSNAGHTLAATGAVGPPTLVQGNGPARQAFWWDSVEGLVSAYSDGAVWYSAQAARAEATESGVPGPVPFGAQLATNSAGDVIACWIAREGAAEGPVLCRSQAIGFHLWADAAVVAESATAFRLRAGGDGALHLLLARSAEAEEASAGLYYLTYSEEAGEWSEPVQVAPVGLIEGSALSDSDLDVDATNGQRRAAWLDPMAGALFYSGSADGGVTWSAPLNASEGVAEPAHPQVAADGDNTIYVFQTAGSGLLQTRIDASGGLVDGPKSILSSYSGAALRSGWQLAGQGTDRLLLVVPESPVAVAIATWLGDGWSEQVVPLSGAASSTPADEAAAMAAHYQEGLLSITTVSEAGQAVLWDLPAAASGWGQEEGEIWSWPVRSASLAEGVGRPAAQIDGDLRVHVLWHTGSPYGDALWYAQWLDTKWSAPVQVVRPDEGIARDPDLAVIGEHLHAVWSAGFDGGPEATVTYTSDASAASSWPLGRALPGPVSPRNAIGAHPALTADLAGTVHAVYAVPINQYRGIYYTQSSDRGETWRASSLVFDAAVAGWAMVDDPAIAVDHDGTLYVAWVRQDLAGISRSRGLYVAQSDDGGERWSEPRFVSEGECENITLVLAAGGGPHLLWQEAGSEHGVWESYSSDSGARWSLPSRVRGYAALEGAAGIATDGQGRLFLAGIQAEDGGRQALLTAKWERSTQQWTIDEPVLLPRAVTEATDVSLALEPDAGRLAAIVSARALSEGEGDEPVLLAMSRPVEPRGVGPEWLGDAQVAPTTQAQPTTMPSVTPQASVPAEAPTSANGTVAVGPMTVPILSIGGIVLVALLVAGVLVVRGRARL